MQHTAVAPAKHGHNITILDLRKEGADAIIGEIKANGGKAMGIAGNVLERIHLKQQRKKFS